MERPPKAENDAAPAAPEDVDDGALDPELEEIEWGGSLLNMREIVISCLDAIEATSVLEIGAYRGDLTELLLDWAAGAGAGVTSIEPVPQPILLERASRHPELELIRAPSHDALAGVALPDAVILDGDHNYYTLSGELRLIGEMAGGGYLPLMIFHDVGWPHGRRDSYYTPERIPEEGRQPMALGVGVLPGEPGTVEEGLRFTEWTALREGGPRNGVLTAIEDFIEGREGLRLAIIPAFFGVGILYREDAPWAPAVAAILEPYVENPIIERLEANRVVHLLKRQVHARQLADGRIRRIEQERLLREMLDSNAFAIAERLSRLRQRGDEMSWREQVEHALGEGNGASGSNRDA